MKCADMHRKIVVLKIQPHGGVGDQRQKRAGMCIYVYFFWHMTPPYNHGVGTRTILVLYFPHIEGALLIYISGDEYAARGINSVFFWAKEYTFITCFTHNKYGDPSLPGTKIKLLFIICAPSFPENIN